MATTSAVKKNYILEIFKTGHDFEDAVSLLDNAFVFNNQLFLKEADEKIIKAQESKCGLTEELILNADDDASASLYADIPPVFERIAVYLENISRAVKTKINEEALFSDKGITEINYLLQRTREVINTTSDLIIARNVFVAEYIIESLIELERTADRFRDLHENRLIGGLCLPKTSGIYISILDAVKNIAWSIKEIAQKLG